MTDLLTLNVNERVEKKGQLSYLSWAWAWAEVLKYDPAATWIVHLYGPKVFARCCWAILTQRETTFLNLVFGK